MPTRGAALIAAVALVSSCGLLAPGELVLEAELVDDSVASPQEPLFITATARNPGEGRVTWGPGSSSCQLHLVVRVDGIDRFVPITGRVCTADLATHVLKPGERRTETLAWTGEAQMGEGLESIELLPPGKYELRVYAIDGGKSAPVSVVLESES